MVASLYYYNLQYYKNCFILNTDYTKKNLIILDLNNIVREALTAGHLAHLVTLNKDGSSQVSIVWVGLDGDEIVCAHQNLYQ